MKRVGLLLVGLGIALLSAIGIHWAFSMPNLTMPNRTEVKRIEFSGKLRVDSSVDGVTTNRPIAVISDPNQIAELLALIEKQNAGWGSTWHTFPTPKHTIKIYGKDENLILVVWLGDGWVGVREGNTNDRLHGIADTELQELLSYGPPLRAPP